MSIPDDQCVERATSGDVAALYRLRRGLEEWLHAKGVQQWPRGEVDHEEIALQVSSNEWHVLRHSQPDVGRVEVAAAMRVLWSDPTFWGADSTRAVYVHGLMVDRAMAGLGLGPFMLDRASQIGREAGADTFRLDCAESNGVLRAFYRKQDFREVGRRDFDDLFGVTLFEKAI